MQLLLAKVGEEGRRGGGFTILAAIGSFGARYHFYPLNRDLPPVTLAVEESMYFVLFWRTHKPQPSAFEYLQRRNVIHSQRPSPPPLHRPA